MPKPILLSPACWACFRMDLRRYWPRQRFALATAAFSGILLLQAAVTYLTLQQFGGGGEWSFWLSTVASGLGLISPFATAFPGLGRFSSFLPNWYAYWSSTSALLITLFLFVAPACLALSITADRRQQRLQELVLTGIPPGELLLAKGLASSLPFAVLLAAYWGASLLFTFGVLIPMQHDPSIPGFLRDSWFGKSSQSSLYAVVGMGARAVLFPVGWVAEGAAFICFSALSRRVSVALILCYGWALGWNAVFRVALPLLLLSMFRGEPGLESLASVVASLAVSAAVFGILVPFTCRALSHPEDAGRPTHAPASVPEPSDL